MNRHEQLQIHTLLSKGALSDSGSSDHSDDEDESYYLPDNCLQSASVLQSKGEGDHIPGGKSHPGVEQVEESKKVSISNPSILDEGETGAQAPMEIPSSKDDEGENLQDLHSTPHYNHQSKKNSII
ncbi:unnamed protein product [Moneuplotes crassus]|uniref:Uncharacterized protein n=1 Tax=Euplotes crassus TaxID=5936 RepID=A0AAD2D001_EUPCR|nr:unnamed protein product [Moneuplotes crassus]